MRRGVKPQKKKTASAAIIAVVLNIIVWGGLGLLFAIHKIVVQHQMDVSLITMKQAKFKPVKLPPAKKAQKNKSHHKPKATSAKKPGAKAKPGPPHPHFMASTPTPGGSGHGTGQTVQSGGTGQAGQIAGQTSRKTQPPAPPAQKQPPKTAPPPPKPIIQPPAPQPKAPILHEVASGATASAVPIKTVLPQIPDSLRDQALTTSVSAQILVASDGSFNVKLLSSSGNSQIDQIVLDALKQWTWQPATANGIPYSTTLNYKVKIEVQ